MDIDGVLVVAHSEKEDAAATWRKMVGHHPRFAFVDHGREGSREQPAAGLLRPGNVGSNTAADHIDIARLTLAQLLRKYRRGRRTLVGTDSGGGTHGYLGRLAARGRCLSYSVGMILTDAIHPGVLRCRLWAGRRLSSRTDRSVTVPGSPGLPGTIRPACAR